jgi:hypothetical protein
MKSTENTSVKSRIVIRKPVKWFFRTRDERPATPYGSIDLCVAKKT